MTDETFERLKLDFLKKNDMFINQLKNMNKEEFYSSQGIYQLSTLRYNVVESYYHLLEQRGLKLTLNKKRP